MYSVDSDFNQNRVTSVKKKLYHFFLVTNTHHETKVLCWFVEFLHSKELTLYLLDSGDCTFDIKGWTEVRL